MRKIRTTTTIVDEIDFRGITHLEIGFKVIDGERIDSDVFVVNSGEGTVYTAEEIQDAPMDVKVALATFVPEHVNIKPSKEDGES